MQAHAYNKDGGLAKRFPVIDYHQGKAASDGVGIGVPVAEVEDISIPVDVIAILLLADAHGFVWTTRIDIGCPCRLFWQEENEENNPGG